MVYKLTCGVPTVTGFPSALIDSENILRGVTIAGQTDMSRLSRSVQVIQCFQLYGCVSPKVFHVQFFQHRN